MAAAHSAWGSACCGIKDVLHGQGYCVAGGRSAPEVALLRWPLRIRLSLLLDGVCGGDKVCCMCGATAPTGSRSALEMAVVSAQ